MIPLLFSTGDLAAYLRYPHRALVALAFDVPDEEKYSVFLRPKRNGGERSIMVPSLTLKMVQRRLHILLDELYRPNSRAHGYVAGRGLRTNATPHIGKRYILNADLSDFFGTINFGRVRGRLMAAPYNLTDAVATTIAKLVTCNDRLPMGAPTSPVLSNILCSGLDAKLAEIAKGHGCFFTRYADDMTFSTNRRNFPKALAEVENDDGTFVTIPGKELILAIEDQGFKINTKKTRLLSRNDRQEVCGVVCNTKLNVLPKLRRQIRASLHAWRKFGLEAAEQEWNEKFNFRNAQSFEFCVRGKIEFLKHIRGASDPLVAKYADQFNVLRKSAKEITYTPVHDWRGDLSRTSCCIESYMNEGSAMCQGSGFVVEGGYIVTNRHVVVAKSGKRFDNISLKFPGSINLNIEVDVIAEMEEHDLALLKVRDEAWLSVISRNICSISDRDAERDDVIWLSGWPNYNNGDDVHLVQGNVLTNMYPEGIRMFRISPNIVFGNSGGPVFDEEGKVVGVATRGSDVADAPLTVHNGCLPASHIKTLLEKVT